ncbi:conserved hypothetical protein [Coccidioides posadasii str. Silveira]|uniref:Uncharacterized protein n=1 Tax=Coccidioides posadasii (strain RMSCC 757 / Silveira) TaxID=443226 RepID=E9CRW2_COCPS|nr:conserved hypothetical protein [Coccidioides posadasii str. Silveira]
MSQSQFIIFPLQDNALYIHDQFLEKASMRQKSGIPNRGTQRCVIFEYVPPPFHTPHRRHRASFDSSVKSMRAANGIGREIHASPCSRY